MLAWDPKPDPTVQVCTSRPLDHARAAAWPSAVYPAHRLTRSEDENVRVNADHSEGDAISCHYSEVAFGPASVDGAAVPKPNNASRARVLRGLGGPESAGAPKFASQENARLLGYPGAAHPGPKLGLHVGNVCEIRRKFAILENVAFFGILSF